MVVNLVIKFVATGCQILRLKCTKFNFGLRPRTRWGSLSAPPEPLAAIGGSTSKGRGGEREEREGEREGKGKGKEGEGKERGKGGRGREPPTSC